MANDVSWGNYKIPLQTDYDSRVIKMSDIEQTKNGNDMLTITFVHNFYDPDEEDNQGSFWFTAKFFKDDAKRHEKYISVGDTVIVKPMNNPLQISTSNDKEYGDRINCSFFSPRLKYISTGGGKKEEEKEEKKERRERPGGRSRGSKPSGASGGRRRKKKAEGAQDESYFRQ